MDVCVMGGVNGLKQGGSITVEGGIVILFKKSNNHRYE
jgi:hypothetical protein